MKMLLFTTMIFLGSGMLFTSCKRNYTCTCTTSIGSVSNTVVHDLQKQRIHDANDACERFETDANNTGIGTTNCHL